MFVDFPYENKSLNDVKHLKI